MNRGPTVGRERSERSCTAELLTEIRRQRHNGQSRPSHAYPATHGLGPRTHAERHLGVTFGTELWGYALSAYATRLPWDEGLSGVVE